MRGDRVEYRRGEALTEWALRQAGGIEQGFTLTRRPAGSGSLVLEVEPSDRLRARLSTGGDAIELLTSSGALAGRYSHLRVADAAGRAVPAAFAVEGQNAAIRVDDEHAEYPLVVDPLLTQVQEIVANDAASGNNFGAAVSASGGVLVVGAPGAPAGAGRGAAYVFSPTGVQGQQQKLTAPGGGTPGDGFGSSVSTSGSFIVVGAPNANATGAATVFSQSGQLWTAAATLTAPGLRAGDLFGGSVAVTGSTIFVGAENTGGGVGAVYVFTNTAGGWAFQSSLSVRASAALIAGDVFGHAIAIGGAAAIVGAPGRRGTTGSAFIFAASGNAWTLQQEIEGTGAVSGDEFGTAVALDPATGVALIGAPGTNAGAGTAYAFALSGATTWSQTQVLAASPASTSGDNYGFAVAISGNDAAIGAPFAAQGVGAVYGFSALLGGSWNALSQDLSPGDATAVPESFGRAVTLLNNSTLWVGAPTQSTAALQQSGAAYEFGSSAVATPAMGAWTPCLALLLGLAAVLLMRGKRASEPRMASPLLLLLLVGGSSCRKGEAGPQPEAVPECVEYEHALARCTGVNAPIATQPAALASTDADRERLKALCAENMQQLREACR